MAKAKDKDPKSNATTVVEGSNALETEIKEAIRVTKEEIEVAEEEDKKVNEIKIVTYWDIGKRINNLTKSMSTKEKKAITDRFSAETDMSSSFYYLAIKFASTFTEEQYKKAVANGMRVRVMKALVGNKKISDARRAELIQLAITKGLDDSDVRVQTGTKGTRRAATKQQRVAAAKKQPPRKVFTTALDRTLLLEESVGFATDAIGRLPKMDEKDVAEATKILVQLRDKADDVNKVVSAFLKYTSNFSKKKGAK